MSLKTECLEKKYKNLISIDLSFECKTEIENRNSNYYSFAVAFNLFIRLQKHEFKFTEGKSVKIVFFSNQIIDRIS